MKNIILMCESHNGNYIPQILVPRLIEAGWRDIPQDASDIVLDLGNEQYWEVWEEILNNATYIEPGTDREFKLHHDGDVFAYCPDSCTPMEYHNLFGEYPAWYSKEEEQE